MSDSLATPPLKRVSIGRVVKPGRFSPAVFVPGGSGQPAPPSAPRPAPQDAGSTPPPETPPASPPATPPPAPPSGEIFSPEALAEKFGLWRHNRPNGSYYALNGNDEYLSLCWRDVTKVLPVRTKPQEGEMHTEEQRLHTYVLQQRNVSHVMEGLAGHPVGMFKFEGSKVLVLSAAEHIQPAPVPFPLLRQYLQELLPAGRDGVKQWLLFSGWMRRSIVAVTESQPLAGQILILCGGTGHGKSFLQHNIITPSLGGRSADPGPFLLKETNFNSECFASESLVMEDPASGLKKAERHYFKQKLKGFAANPKARFHEKGRPAVTLPPIWRVSISINDGPNDLAILPPPSQDFNEKVLMFQTARPSCLPGASGEERARFRESLRRELPGYIHWLMNGFEASFPADLVDSRYGVRSYENPALRESLKEGDPCWQLLEMIDQAKPWLRSSKGVWKGSISGLEDLLEGDGDVSSRYEKWRRWHALVDAMQHLRIENPDRVRYGGASNARWSIFPPELESAEPVVDGEDPF